MARLLGRVERPTLCPLGALRHARATVLVLLLAALLPSCTDDSEDARLRRALAEHGVTALSAPPAQDPALVELGKNLFCDKILSGSRNVSCLTCHQPQLGLADGIPVALGEGAVGIGEERTPTQRNQFMARNALDLFNRGVDGFHTFFWDGRAQFRYEKGHLVATTPNGVTPLDDMVVERPLELVSMFPVLPSVEMKGDINAAPDNDLAQIPERDAHAVWAGYMKRLVEIDGYRDLFAKAYPDVPRDDLEFKHAGKAIAAFITKEFTLLDAPFDRYLRGDDAALGAEAKRGALLFYGKANCVACHSGSLLTDFAFHNIGVPQLGPGMDMKSIEDLGRGNETKQSEDRFLFRTPPLRNVATSAPWFHNGSFDDLRAVVVHHLDPQRSHESVDLSHLTPQMAKVTRFETQNRNVLHSLDPLLVPIELTESEISDLVRFLESLTDPRVDSLIDVIPTTVPSGLPVDRVSPR